MNEIQRRKKENNYLIWISKIINEEVTNSNIKNITVVDAELSNDGSHLKVYVLFEKNETKGIETLNKIKGFIKSQLAQYDFNSRKIPDIIFKLDNVQKNYNRIEELLKQIKKQEEKNEK